MTEEVILIQKYIDEKKELQKLVLQIIEKTDTSEDDDLQNLQKFLDSHKYQDNKKDNEHFLHLLLIISLNHHRHPNFFDKIDKILQISSKFYKPHFSNDELFTFFQQSKPILLLLIKAKIIIIDEIIIKHLLSFSEKNGNEEYYYFYPELKEIIKSGSNQQMGSELYKIKMNEDIEKFEINRRTFENESELCSLIRNDLIDDFIFYVHKNNISLETPIKRSIFETNSILNEKEPTLIEYAFFFGSIQIIKYLEINDVSLKPSMWIYAVHSDNAEVIGFLEAKNIEIDERTFSEVIKCHHNSIAHYLYDKLFDNQTSIKDLSFEPILNIYSLNNYEFFSYETDCGYLFFSLIKSGYDELVEYHLKAEKNEIKDFIKQYQDDDTQKIIIKALSEKKIDAAYYLMSEYLDCIPKEFNRIFFLR